MRRPGLFQRGIASYSVFFIIFRKKSQMKRIAGIATLLQLMLVAGLTAQSSAPQREFIYVGTFDERGSQGIYVFRFDRNASKFELIQTVRGKSGPSFLSIHPNKRYLYSVNREGMQPSDQHGSVSSFRIDVSNGKLSLINEQSSMGAGPCHVSVDPRGRQVYVSNYNSGSLAVLPIEARDGSLDPASAVIQHSGNSVHATRQEKPHMHSAIPTKNGRHLLASDLGIDKIVVYALSPDGAPVEVHSSTARANPGSGPRHLALHPKGLMAFSAEELSSTLSSYRLDPGTGALQPANRHTTLPAGFSDNNSVADVHVSPDGKYVYVSNRGHNSLAFYSINPRTAELYYQGHHDTRGQTPRNFMIDPKGEFVLVANQNSDNMVLFKRNRETGALVYSGVQVSVPAPVCILHLNLK
jgi:6-phosphogluconolactonase